MSKQSGRAHLLAPVVEQLALCARVASYVWAHPTNSGQRARALLRAIGYQANARLLRRRTLARLGERSRLWVDPHRTAASKVLYANPPDLPEMLVWQRVLKNGGLFIDVGANVGTYTIWAAELGAEVIALEPAADTFALLQENIALNAYQVTAVQAAAGDHCGTARFTSGLDAGNSLASDGPVVTELVTVDALIGDRRVAGMKVDVEGFEIDVLRGAARALADRRIGLIQVEWNEMSILAVGADRRPVAELLAGYGYRLYRPDVTGRLVPVSAPGFGTDVFACPAPENTLASPSPQRRRGAAPSFTPSTPGAFDALIITFSYI
jgi:FkbM family methyltransferase